MYRTVIFNFHYYVDILTTLYTVLFRREFEFFVSFFMNSLTRLCKPRACGVWLKIRLCQLSFATFV